MQKNKLGKTGMEVGAVVFGGIICMQETQKDSNRFVSYAIDHGVNYFDVAPSYGDAEVRLGSALKPYRNKVYLACKTTERTATGARKELEQSLKNLETDYFDVYQMHAVTTQEDVDAIFAQDGAMKTFVKAKEEGLIKHIGITSHNADAALRALSMFEYSTVMYPVNWALGMGTDFEKTLPDVCKEKYIGFHGMKTLAHRMWRENEEKKYPKSWCRIIYDDERLGKCALKYTLSRGTNTVVPPGNFDSFEFCVANIDECLNNPLSIEETAYLKSMLPGDNEHIF